MSARGPLAKFLIWAAILWTLGVTLLRAIRLPNDFSEAHWLLDYRFGFIKRGFVGSLCALVTAPFGVRLTGTAIAVLSGIVLAVYCMALLLVLRRVVLRQSFDHSAVLLALAVASSPFVVMSAHLVGYFDSLLYLIAICAVLLLLSGRPWAAGVLQGIAVLIHESYVLTAYPAVCLAAVLLVRSAPGIRPRLRVLAAQSLPLVALVLLVGYQAALNADDLRVQLRQYLDSFGFASSRSALVAEFQTRGFFSLFREESRLFGQRCLDPTLLGLVGPTLMATVFFAHVVHPLRVGSWLSLFALVACLAPLAMHAVAWDTPRIWTHTIGAGALVVWVLAETGESRSPSAPFALLAVPAFLLNVFARVPLMDSQVDRFSLTSRLLLYGPGLALAVWATVSGRGEGKTGGGGG